MSSISINYCRNHIQAKSKIRQKNGFGVSIPYSWRKFTCTRTYKFWFKMYSCFKSVKKLMQKQKSYIFPSDDVFVCFMIYLYKVYLGFYYIHNHNFQSAGSFNTEEIECSFCLNMVSTIVYTDRVHQNKPKMRNALHKVLNKISKFKVSTQ